MTFFNFLDRNLKTILVFITVSGLTGWFGIRPAYLSSAQFFGIVQAAMIDPTTLLRLVE